MGRRVGRKKTRRWKIAASKAAKEKEKGQRSEVGRRMADGGGRRAEV